MASHSTGQLFVLRDTIWMGGWMVWYGEERPLPLLLYFAQSKETLEEKPPSEIIFHSKEGVSSSEQLLGKEGG